MKKYELMLDDAIQVSGETLYRIRALRDFVGVRAGDIGGYIAKEKNLSHAGNAWVSGDARVSGDSRVSGNATVSGDAMVHGGEWITSPLYIQGTRYSFNISSPDTIRCGCQDHTWREWHDAYQAIADKHNAADIVREYVLYFNLACKLYGHEDCMIQS